MEEPAVRSPEFGNSFRAVIDILRAARFAAEKHAAQTRKGAAAEPYVNHLLEVAELVCEVSASLRKPGGRSR